MTRTADLRFRRIFDSQAHYIFKLACRYGLQDADAADACQRAFVVLARRLNDVRPGRERSFLSGTVVRISLELRRSRASRREVATTAIDTAVAAESCPDRCIERRRAREVLDVVLSSMPTKLRTVFELHELHEHTTADIANMLAIPMGTAASRLRRARERFQRIAPAARTSWGRRC